MGPHWFAAFLFCAIAWFLLALVATVPNREGKDDARRLRQAVLVAGLAYLVLWALGASGPFVAWR